MTGTVWLFCTMGISGEFMENTTANCYDCAMESLHQPCEACDCSGHGILLEPRPDPTVKEKAAIRVCPACSDGPGVFK